MKTPESFEKADVDKYLESIGAYILKPTTFGFGKSGAPDRVCCYLGYFAGFEIKREGKEPTAIQNRRMKEIREAGGVAFWGTAEKVIKEFEDWRQNV